MRTLRISRPLGLSHFVTRRFLADHSVTFPQACAHRASLAYLQTLTVTTGTLHCKTLQGSGWVCLEYSPERSVDKCGMPPVTSPWLRTVR